MKALLLTFLLLGSTSAMAKRLVVLANIALLPESGYATMPKDAGCDKQTDSGDLLGMCVGGWSRYCLTGVTLLDGTRFEDTIALIYTRTRFLVAGGASHYAALMHRRPRAMAPNIRLFRPAVRTKRERRSDVL
jgi:hypothetical protein